MRARYSLALAYSMEKNNNISTRQQYIGFFRSVLIYFLCVALIVASFLIVHCGNAIGFIVNQYTNQTMLINYNAA